MTQPVTGLNKYKKLEKKSDGNDVIELHIIICNSPYHLYKPIPYLVENGRIKNPLKGVTLIGNGPDAMNKVKMIGNDLKLDDGIGTCGKDGQGVPVGVGQPTLLMEGITIGGTKTN